MNGKRIGNNFGYMLNNVQFIFEINALYLKFSYKKVIKLYIFRKIIQASIDCRFLFWLTHFESEEWFFKNCGLISLPCLASFLIVFLLKNILIQITS